MCVCVCVCVSGLEFLWWRKQVLAQRPRWSLLAISFPYSCSKIRTVNLPHCLIHQPPRPHQHTHIPITHTHTQLARTSARPLQSVPTQKEMSRKENTAWWKPLFITYDRHACGSFMLSTEASPVKSATSCRPLVLQEVLKCWQESCGMACGNREDRVRPERSSVETCCIFVFLWAWCYIIW